MASKLERTILKRAKDKVLEIGAATHHFLEYLETTGGGSHETNGMINMDYTCLHIELNSLTSLVLLDDNGISSDGKRYLLARQLEAEDLGELVIEACAKYDDNEDDYSEEEMSLPDGMTLN